MFTEIGVKQLNDFLRTVTAASDLVDCTSVNCELVRVSDRKSRFLPITITRLCNILRFFTADKKHVKTVTTLKRRRVGEIDLFGIINFRQLP